MISGHYHLHLHPISRGQGHNLSAALAYRHGVRIEATIPTASAAAAYRHAQAHGNDAQAFDYRRKIGVQWFGIFAPAHAPAWMQDPRKLWAAVDMVENRKNARFAQELIIALPHQMGLEDHLGMLESFVRTHCIDRYSMIADVAIHAPPVHAGGDPRNVHAHSMLTDRPVTADGFAPKKDRRYQAKHLVQEFREGWTLTHNRHMERLGLPHRIDHRRLDVQRQEALSRGDHAAAMVLDRLPQVHLGKALHAGAPGRPIYLERLAEYKRRLATNSETMERYARRNAEDLHQANHTLLLEERAAATRPLPDLPQPPRPHRPFTGFLARAWKRPLLPTAATSSADAGDADESVPSLLADILAVPPMRTSAPPVFTVTKRDFAFIFYRMGVTTLAELQTSLTSIRLEDTQQRARRQERLSAWLTRPLAPRRPPRQAARRQPTRTPTLARALRLEAEHGRIRLEAARRHSQELDFARRHRSSQLQRQRSGERRPAALSGQAFPQTPGELLPHDRSRARLRTPLGTSPPR